MKKPNPELFEMPLSLIPELDANAPELDGLREMSQREREVARALAEQVMDLCQEERYQLAALSNKASALIRACDVLGDIVDSTVIET